MIRITLIAAALLVASPVSARDKQPCGHRVEVHGMSMYYEVSGKGDPLVVMHGAQMNIETMGEIIPVLAKTHRVYAMELQGHGRTTDIDRPITYENLADDVAVFMDAVHLAKADVFGYSMGAAAALQLAIRHPEKVDQLIVASPGYSNDGWQPAYQAFIPQLSPETFAPFEEEWAKLTPNPEGWPAFIDKMIALEHEQFDWEAQLKASKTPTLIIGGDADVVTLSHLVSMFHLLGGGVMGDMGEPLSASRLAILPATSHTAVINQPQLLHAFIEPFLQGITPQGFMPAQ